MQTCYCGYMSNEEELLSVSSGGLATAISDQIIDDGGVVYGVAYTDGFRGAQFVRVHTKEGLNRLRGSKYIKSIKNKCDGKSVYLSVYEDLLSGNTVAFFGLPCEVAALYSYLNKKECDYSTLLLAIDLICHGPTQPRVAVQFIDALERKYKAKIVDFTVRYKKPNWTPPYLRAVFENGKVYCRKFYLTDYGRAFALLSMPPCYQCRFKGDNHLSDITVGDYWGISKEDAGYNQKGVSIAFVNSDKGEKLLLSLRGFNLFQADMNKVLHGNPMYSASKVKTAQNTRFASDFERLGLHIACKKSYTMRERIIYWIVDPIITRFRKIQECILQK